jgi:hypothetical protein
MSDDTRMRFATLGGALVVVTRTPGSKYRDHTWKCLGCHAGPANREPDWLISEDDARDQANGHASRCRSLPQPNRK